MSEAYSIESNIKWEYEGDIVYKYHGFLGNVQVFTIVQCGERFELWTDLPGMYVRDFEYFGTPEEVMEKAQSVINSWLSMLSGEKEIANA